MIRQELNPETCRLEMKSKPNVKDQKIIPDCDNREVKLQLGGSRLGRVPCQSKIATKNAGTSSWPSWISHFTGSFVGHSPSEMLCPPALGSKRKRTEGRKREKFYIYSDVTHTPGQSRVNPERQEEEKSGHTKGKRPKTAQGGEGNRRTSGTNLHGETDLTKTAHAPKPHDTLRRSTRGN